MDVVVCQYPGFQRIFFSDRYFAAKPRKRGAKRRGEKKYLFFFSSALRASLTRLRRDVSIRKKYPLEPRVICQLMMYSNVIVGITISRGSFVFSQSRVKVSSTWTLLNA